MISKDTYVKTVKRKYANIFFGYNDTVYDSHLLGYVIKELGVISQSPLHIRKENNFWFISTTEDWVKKFIETDEDFLFIAYDWDKGLSGIILSAFSNGVGLALNGKITASYNLELAELNDIALKLLNFDRRVIFFKSVENTVQRNN